MSEKLEVSLVLRIKESVFCFALWPHLWHMEVLGQGIESCRCSNARSFSPLHLAGDRTHASAPAQATAGGFLTHCITTRTPCFCFFFFCCYSHNREILLIYFLVHLSVQDLWGHVAHGSLGGRYKTLKNRLFFHKCGSMDSRGLG